MAKKQVVTVSYTCDLCGADIAEAVENAGQHITWDGREYEIDLCETDQRGLQQALEGLRVYVSAGRRLTLPGRGRRRIGAQHAPRGDTSPVRAWARSNGWPELGERGRVPNKVMAAYEAAGSPR